MKFFYDLGMFLFLPLMGLAGIFNRKARLFYQGRRDTWSLLRKHFDPSQKTIWFHAASLGEFEQGRPVMEAFRAAHPDFQLLVTFFSPSGYEIRKNYSDAGCVCYLPTDTPRNVKNFLQLVKPDIVVFIKYEFWLNYLEALRQYRIPTYIISAIFRPEQIFFKPYGAIFRKALQGFTHLFVQNENSRQLLLNIGIKPVTVAGDTRFDRVWQVAQQPNSFPILEKFAHTFPVLIAGSTWPHDEALLLELVRKRNGIKFIIAPHEIESDRIEDLRGKTGKKTVRYTQISESEDISGADVLILDTIGILSSAYHYGKWAYIGGGFGAGIHNILEAAAFGLPLAFGPRYEKFQEARDLIRLGGARSLSNAEELNDWLTGLTHGETYGKTSRICSEYVKNHYGATDKIMQELQKMANR